MSHLLGGRIRHEQPTDGHRSGIEPVLLAASIPVKPGEMVLEGGTGSGAALLCLAARCPTLDGLGLELDCVRAEIARANFAANGFDRLRVLTADVTDWAAARNFDHALANPPFHPAEGTPSPDPARALARTAEAGLLAKWAASLARCLHPQGTLTFIVSAAALPEAIAAFAAASCGSLAIFPFWPKAGRPAKLVLLQGRRDGRAPARLLPGLVLHGADGHFTSDTDAILRQNADLTL